MNSLPLHQYKEPNREDSYCTPCKAWLMTALLPGLRSLSMRGNSLTCADPLHQYKEPKREDS